MTRLPQYQKKLKQRSTSALILKECISTFNNLFTVSDLMDQMLARGKGEVETFNIFVNLVANGLIIPISPLTEILVQEFLPLIDPIPKDERIALKQIYNGYTDYVKLSEITNIPVIVRTLHSLQKKGFLTESNELTDLGSKITTILNIVDD